ncbi:hypothetical protein [Ktedonobacter robiniae]|uniref:hypothetical protein n=1 Tax=Ktedonobacter robiniae TaxID=2778365 RepID=UPI00191607F7|nr:hypothetical protein [Ktedonobacter robiniae]
MMRNDDGVGGGYVPATHAVISYSKFELAITSYLAEQIFGLFGVFVGSLLLIIKELSNLLLPLALGVLLVALTGLCFP